VSSRASSSSMWLKIQSAALSTLLPCMAIRRGRPMAGAGHVGPPQAYGGAERFPRLRVREAHGHDHGNVVLAWFSRTACRRRRRHSRRHKRI
jgi:hypothetical protein